MLRPLTTTMNTMHISNRVGIEPHSSALEERFQSIRQQTVALVEPLSAEDCQLQSMPDASPAKWHLAHLTWFFETFVLERFERHFRPFNAGFRVLFNSYYNAVGDKHPRAQRGMISRPSLQEVMAYRQQVDRRMQALISQRPELDAISRQDLNQLVTLGLHHEQQHQELLLTDIKHALSLNPARPAYARRWPLTGISPQAHGWVRYAGGLLEHGHVPATDGPFAFDNETPRHKVFTAPFEIGDRLVTNGEMMGFMEDGGYGRPELWLAMGWDWLEQSASRMPLYWHRESEGGFSNFTLHGEVGIDANTPVCHLNYFEADAYARWANARLPTEHEWELAARSISSAARPAGNLVENAAYHPLPLQERPHGGPAQMFGDVWEWTQSNYNAYPGFQPWEGLAGEYNGKFMCNQLVLRGGSCVTPQSHIRASYRNFFPPHVQWQFSGIRLARDAA